MKTERFRPRSAFEASLRHPKWEAALLTVEQMRRPREVPRSHDLVADWNKFRISAAGSHELRTKPTVAFTAYSAFSHSNLCLTVYSAASK